MKKLLSLLICTLLIFLCSCAPSSAPAQNNEITLSPYLLPEATGDFVSLYYPTEDLTGVLASTEQIERKSGSFYFDVAQTLITGTKSFPSPFLSGISCRSTMLVQNVLYLDFSHQFLSMEPLRLFACCSVLAKTFTSFAEIDFINITVEGKQLTYPDSTRKIMLLSRFSADTLTLLSAYNALSSSQIDTFYTVLYSAEAHTGFLTPSVKSITVIDADYTRAIVSQALLDKTLFEDGFSFKRAKNNGAQVNIELVAPQAWKAPENWLASRALAAALDSLYPAMQQITLTVFGSTGELLYSLSHETGEVFNHIKSKINVFVPSKNDISYSTMLVSQVPSRNNLKEFMADYIATCAPALRDNKDVVRQVVFAGDLLVLDLDESVYTVFSSLTGQSEYATVFSLVATACAFSGANRVMLLQNGQARSYFSKDISLKNPLYNLPKDFLDSLK